MSHRINVECESFCMIVAMMTTDKALCLDGAIFVEVPQAKGVGSMGWLEIGFHLDTLCNNEKIVMIYIFFSMKLVANNYCL